VAAGGAVDQLGGADLYVVYVLLLPAEVYQVLSHWDKQDARDVSTTDDESVETSVLVECRVAVDK